MVNEQHEIARTAQVMRGNTNAIFVFGSNTRGIHGAGAAKMAREQHGAAPGQSYGLSGRSYAIPTKDDRMRPLPLPQIAANVREFIVFAKSQPHRAFAVTRVGCGLAGYGDADIAPMFAGAPDNCDLPPHWREVADGVRLEGKRDITVDWSDADMQYHVTGRGDGATIVVADSDPRAAVTKVLDEFQRVAVQRLFATP